ncbi:MAG: aldo/keto reductase [Myxococcota bacterium]
MTSDAEVIRISQPPRPARGPHHLPLRTLGRSGLKVSALGLTARDLGVVEAGETGADALIGAALDAGLNFFGTSAGPLAEERLGRLLKGRRGELVLSIGVRDVEDGSGDALVRSLDRALTRLGTDWIDVMNLRVHPHDPRLAEWIDRLVDARRAGKIRAIGWSQSTFLAGAMPVDPRIDVLEARLGSRDLTGARALIRKAAAQGITVVARMAGGAAIPRQSRLAPASSLSRAELWFRHAADLPGLASILLHARRPSELAACVRWIIRGRLPAEARADLEDSR